MSFPTKSLERGSRHPEHQTDDVGMPTVRRVPLSALQACDGNPKTHSITELRRSIRRFGFVAPILVEDEQDGMYTIFAGHGRLEALATMKDEGESPPDGISVDANGEWIVSVYVGVKFKSVEERDAYVIADNRLTETGGWNMALLTGSLASLGSLTGTGFSESDTASFSSSMMSALRGDKEKEHVDDPVNASARQSHICPACGEEFFTKRGQRGGKKKVRQFDE